MPTRRYPDTICKNRATRKYFSELCGVARVGMTKEGWVGIIWSRCGCEGKILVSLRLSTTKR